MKYKFFEQRISDIVALYKCTVSRDLALQKALGGDTSVSTTDISMLLDKMVYHLAEESGDTYKLIEDLVFDNMLRIDYENNNGSISFNGNMYKANPKSVFNLIKDNKK